jgi:hypothetical protein
MIELTLRYWESELEKVLKGNEPLEPLEVEFTSYRFGIVIVKSRTLIFEHFQSMLNKQLAM